MEEAEGRGGGRERGEESVKLFVGQVPRHMTEEELMALFKEVSLVDEVSVIKDKVTKASRGCCFLICPSREEADKAVAECHNKRTLPGAASPMQVKYADGELERLEHKLFIGMLPKNVSDADIAALFSKYGAIRDLKLLRGSQHTNKGCAFLKYETKEQALAALEALNGKHRMEGSSVPLVVKWADTEKERQARRAQKAPSQASGISYANSMQHQSLFGALPMGYIPAYNGYGYQPTGNYGLMQYPLTSMQSQAAFHNMIPPVNQANTLHAISSDVSTTPRNFNTAQSGGFIGSPYPAPSSGFQYPLSYQIKTRHLGNSHSSDPPVNMTINQATPSSPRTISGRQIEGPPGANLFIYHIPQEYGDQELANAFQRFGRVLSAKVFVDKATGVSKCFGFVSYDLPTAAQIAIDAMNGSQLGGKKLKVQLKKENKNLLSKPY
ncbi:RNA-binding protein BRN1-like [Zingiber officinale]|uniref:RNA-binding protein BRN1-like n=1 Tax=Zingiber officinale TaxID=94328 RepID=UPI001C4D938A|nr:RNA-binding protein BRN1-like [Zingiber officinale]XP_042431594.1 RNA-binding protein BRN1-like [Zingiber officinale]